MVIHFLYFVSNNVQVGGHETAKRTTMTKSATARDLLEGDGNASEIMKQVHALYTHPEDGLVALARSVEISKIHPPRRKVNVLVIGNHSAGKSSFINWYIDDNVQRTGVAIETQGFTVVTSGSKKTLAPIKGDSTIMLYPYLEPLKARFGKPLVENLETCVSVSTTRSFSMVRTYGLAACFLSIYCPCLCEDMLSNSCGGIAAFAFGRWISLIHRDLWMATSCTLST